MERVGDDVAFVHEVSQFLYTGRHVADMDEKRQTDGSRKLLAGLDGFDPELAYAGIAGPCLYGDDVFFILFICVDAGLQIELGRIVGFRRIHEPVCRIVHRGEYSGAGSLDGVLYEELHGGRTCRACVHYRCHALHDADHVSWKTEPVSVEKSFRVEYMGVYVYKTRCRVRAFQIQFLHAFRNCQIFSDL